MPRTGTNPAPIKTTEFYAGKSSYAGRVNIGSAIAGRRRNHLRPNVDLFPGAPSLLEVWCAQGPAVRPAGRRGHARIGILAGALPVPGVPDPFLRNSHAPSPRLSLFDRQSDPGLRRHSADAHHDRNRGCRRDSLRHHDVHLQ